MVISFLSRLGRVGRGLMAIILCSAVSSYVHIYKVILPLSLLQCVHTCYCTSYVLYGALHVCIIWCPMYYMMPYVLYGALHVCIIWCPMYYMMPYVLYGALHICIIWCPTYMYYMMPYVSVFPPIPPLQLCIIIIENGNFLEAMHYSEN